MQQENLMPDGNIVESLEMAAWNILTHKRLSKVVAPSSEVKHLEKHKIYGYSQEQLTIVHQAEGFCFV